MASRPNVYVCRRVPVDGGKSPNAYYPQVTVELRTFFPSRQVERALEEFDLAVAEARQKLEAKVREYQEWAHG